MEKQVNNFDMSKILKLSVAQEISSSSEQPSHYIINKQPTLDKEMIGKINLCLKQTEKQKPQVKIREIKSIEEMKSEDWIESGAESSISEFKQNNHRYYINKKKQKPPRCLYCFSNHHLKFKCPSIILVYKKKGKNFCRHSKTFSCYICEKDESKLPHYISHLEPFKEESKQQRCLACHKYGHLNCLEYAKEENIFRNIRIKQMSKKQKKIQKKQKKIERNHSNKTKKYYEVDYKKKFKENKTHERKVNLKKRRWKEINKKSYQTVQKGDQQIEQIFKRKKIQKKFQKKQEFPKQSNKKYKKNFNQQRNKSK